MVLFELSLRFLLLQVLLFGGGGCLLNLTWPMLCRETGGSNPGMSCVKMLERSKPRGEAATISPRNLQAATSSQDPLMSHGRMLPTSTGQAAALHPDVRVHVPRMRAKVASPASLPSSLGKIMVQERQPLHLKSGSRSARQRIVEREGRPESAGAGQELVECIGHPSSHTARLQPGLRQAQNILQRKRARLRHLCFNRRRDRRLHVGSLCRWSGVSRGVACAGSASSHAPAIRPRHRLHSIAAGKAGASRLTGFLSISEPPRLARGTSGPGIHQHVLGQSRTTLGPQTDFGKWW